VAAFGEAVELFCADGHAAVSGVTPGGGGRQAPSEPEVGVDRRVVRSRVNVEIT